MASETPEADNADATTCQADETDPIRALADFIEQNPKIFAKLTEFLTSNVPKGSLKLEKKTFSPRRTHPALACAMAQLWRDAPERLASEAAEAMPQSRLMSSILGMFYCGFS